MANTPFNPGFVIHMSNNIPTYDTTELTAWMASNPLAGEVIYSIDDGAFVTWDEDNQVAVILAPGAGAFKYLHFDDFSGHLLHDDALVDAQIVTMHVDGVEYTPHESGPLIIHEYEYNDHAGTVRVLGDFDHNNIDLLIKT